MSIDLANLELALIQKINSSDSPLEIQTYSTALNKLRSGTVYNTNTFSSLPVAEDNIGSMYFVADEDTIYVASQNQAKTGWVAIYVQNLQLLFNSGDQCYMASSDTSIRYSTSFVENASNITNWCFVTHWGQYGGAGITADNKLYAWGDSAYGKLGSNNVIPPNQNCPGCNFIYASGGYYQSLVIRDNGTLWGSGLNTAGSLGTGSSVTSHTSLTQEITSSTNWTQVASEEEGSTTSGLKSDGTLWSWGCNDVSSKMGIGVAGAACISSPTQEFYSATNWCQAAMAHRAAQAIKTDGTLWGAGCGVYVGAGIAAIYCSYVQEFCSATNWCKISSVKIATLAVKTDGTLWGWGQNVLGSLGQNVSSGIRCSPVQEITSSTNWCFATIGSCISAGIKTDGSLWNWGNGIGTATGDCICRSSPVQEISSITWTFANASLGCRIAAITGISL